MFFLLSPHFGTRKDSPFMDPYRIQLARFNFKSPGNLRIRGFFLKRIFPPEILKSMLEDILLKSTKKGGWQLNRKFWSHKNPLLINCWCFILALKNWVTLLVGGFKQSEKYESKWESSPAQVEVKIKKNWNHHLVFLSLIQMIPFQKKKKNVPGLGFSTCRLGIGTFIPKAIRTTRICRAARQGRWGTG